MINCTTMASRIALLHWIKSLWRPAMAPLLVFLIHVFGMFGAYGHLPGVKMDVVMHFVGGAAMAYFIHRAAITASAKGIIGGYHPITHRLLIFTATSTVAVFWELAEFAVDWYFGVQFQKGVPDTMADLFLGMIGALFVIALLRKPRTLRPSL